MECSRVCSEDPFAALTLPEGLGSLEPHLQLASEPLCACWPKITDLWSFKLCFIRDWYVFLILAGH